MANAAWTVTAVVMVCALMPGICAAAASNAGVDVVLHVTNYERISGPELIDAEQEVVKVYSKIGVRLAWAGGVFQRLARLWRRSTSSAPSDRCSTPASGAARWKRPPTARS